MITRNDPTIAVTAAFAHFDEDGIAINILVNNAGIQFRKPMLELATADWQRVIDTNLTSAFVVGRAAARRMVACGRGKIVNIGSLTSELARATHIEEVDIEAGPLGIAEQLGATVVHDLGRTPDALHASTTNRGVYDIVFECSGSPQAVATALSTVRPGGTIPLGALVAKEVRLLGAFRFDAEFALDADLIDTGAVDLTPPLTASLPLDDAIAAFDLTSDRRTAMKVQIAL